MITYLIFTLLSFYFNPLSTSLLGDTDNKLECLYFELLVMGVNSLVDRTTNFASTNRTSR